MGSYDALFELEPPALVRPADMADPAPPYVVVDNESLWPVIVTETDGTQWVQIVDGSGHFAGYDPSFEQIAQVVEATTTPDNEPYKYARIAELVGNTVLMHDELAYEGIEEAFELDSSPDMQDFLNDQEIWRTGFRRTEQTIEGEQQ